MQMAHTVLTLDTHVASAIFCIVRSTACFATFIPPSNKAHINLKGKFMQLWDDLIVEDSKSILVLFAISGPHDVGPILLWAYAARFREGHTWSKRVHSCAWYNFVWHTEWKLFRISQDFYHRWRLFRLRHEGALFALPWCIQREKSTFNCAYS